MYALIEEYELFCFLGQLGNEDTAPPSVRQLRLGKLNTDHSLLNTILFQQ